MSPLNDARLKLRAELEAPPAFRRFGSGWGSGVLDLVLGLAGFLLVLTFRAPGTFTTSEMRRLQDGPWFRFGLNFVLLAGLGCSAISMVLRKGKILGGSGVALALLAVLLGGSESTEAVPDPTALTFGLDFFVMWILFTGFLLIPLERLFANRGEQHIFPTVSGRPCSSFAEPKNPILINICG